LEDPFSDFLTRPGADTYLVLRREIIGSPDFDTSSDGLKRLEDLIAQGAHTSVPALVPALMPNWLLSPRVHMLLGEAAEARGESGRAANEARMAEACMFGMKETGAGSDAAPFHPVHVSDEYDLAEFLGRAVLSQRREDRDGRAFDVLACADGSELWFDVTDPVLAMIARAK
jgi:hypothetical protein